MYFIFLIFHIVFVHFFNNAVLYISKREMLFLISLIVVIFRTNTELILSPAVCGFLWNLEVKFLNFFYFLK